VNDHEIAILSVPVRPRRAGREIRMVIDGDAVTKPDARLIKLLLRARRFNAALAQGEGIPFAVLAQREGVSRSYFTRIVRLSYLAPDIVLHDRNLVFHKSVSDGHDDRTIAALWNLPPDHSYVDGIEALIAAAADGSLEPAMYVNVSEVEGEKIGYEAIIEITVQTPGQLGDISIRGGCASGRSVWSAQSIRPASIVASPHRRSRRLEAESERLLRGK
jgi:hypothetical protein